jgi:hypothetical protein
MQPKFSCFCPWGSRNPCHQESSFLLSVLTREQGSISVLNF